MRTRLIGAVLAAATLSPLAVHADDVTERNTYTTTKFSQVTPDFDNLDSAIALGQSAGYPIPGLDWMAIELDLGFVLFGGENSGGRGNSVIGGGGGGGSGLPPCTGAIGEIPGVNCTNDSGGGGGGGNNAGNVTRTSDDFRMFNIGLFLSAQTPGTFYGVAKIGYQFAQTNIDEIEELEGTTGVAYQAGIGYKLKDEGNAGLQLTYQKYNDLVDGISLGLTYGFGR